MADNLYVHSLSGAADQDADQEVCSECNSRNDRIEELRRQLVEARDSITQLRGEVDNLDCQGATTAAAEIKELKKALSDSKSFANGLEQLAIQENRAFREVEAKILNVQRKHEHAVADRDRALSRAAAAEKALARTESELDGCRSALDKAHNIMGNTDSADVKELSEDPFWAEMRILKKTTNVSTAVSDLKAIDFSPPDKVFFGSNEEENLTAIIEFNECHAHSSANVRMRGVSVLTSPAAVFRACRTALVQGPAKARAALGKYRKYIDFDLIRALETVGSYNDESTLTPLYEYVRHGDSATAEFLIAAGADVHAVGMGQIEQIDLANDAACRDLIAVMLIALHEDPDALVVAAEPHCVDLTHGLYSIRPDNLLRLRKYHFDPSFQWAPAPSRSAIFAWALDIYEVLFADTIEPFPELSYDCQSDVLDFLAVTISGVEALNVRGRLSEPRARSWVRAIIAAAVAEDASTDLVSAAGHGDIESVQNCVAKGAEINFQSITEWPLALTEAATNGHADVVEFLLKAGADVEAVSGEYSYRTALVEASINGCTAVVDLLIRFGAKPEGTSYDHEKKALMFASEEGHSAIVELLLEAGADANDVISDHGATALFYASSGGHADVLNILLEAGATLETCDLHTNPLYEAAMNGHTGVVKILLEAGADVNGVNMSGQTALVVAEAKSHTEIVALLQQRLFPTNT